MADGQSKRSALCAQLPAPPVDEDVTPDELRGTEHDNRGIYYMANEHIDAIDTLNDEELDLASGGASLAAASALSSLKVSNIAANVQRFVLNQNITAAHLVMMLHPAELVAIRTTALR
jgi:shikimate 5-dehydrogenase